MIPPIFSSPELTSELMVYPCSGVCSSLTCVCPQCSNTSETAWPIKAKFCVEPPCLGGTKGSLRYQGHMTKMVTTPICDAFLEFGASGGTMSCSSWVSDKKVSFKYTSRAGVCPGFQTLISPQPVGRSQSNK